MTVVPQFPDKRFFPLQPSDAGFTGTVDTRNMGFDVEHRRAVDRVEASTSIASPSTAFSLHVVTPMRFGRFLPRWAKMPTCGHRELPRG